MKLNGFFARLALAAALAMLGPLASAQSSSSAHHAVGVKPTQAANAFMLERSSALDSGDDRDKTLLSAETATGPDFSIAWLFALGFLGLVIFRRPRR